MMNTRRLDHVVVATSDAAGAAATFAGHFDLAGAIPLPEGSPTLAIGAARIAFVTPKAGTGLASALASGGEGMAAVCLEVASLAEAGTSLRRAGIAFTLDDEGGQRALHVDPSAAHGVRLSLIESPRR